MVGRSEPAGCSAETVEAGTAAGRSASSQHNHTADFKENGGLHSDTTHDLMARMHLSSTCAQVLSNYPGSNMSFSEGVRMSAGIL